MPWGYPELSPWCWVGGQPQHEAAAASLLSALCCCAATMVLAVLATLQLTGHQGVRAAASASANAPYRSLEQLSRGWQRRRAAAFHLHLSMFPCQRCYQALEGLGTQWGGYPGTQGRGLTVSLCRAERATAVLLADPCFQLRSIQYLLGHAEPSALAAAAPATDKRHFSLHTCKCRRCAGLTSRGDRAAGVCVPCDTSLSPEDSIPWLPCCLPAVALGMGLCLVAAFGSGSVPSQYPVSPCCPQHGDPCAQHQPLSWLVPRGSCSLPMCHPAAVGWPECHIHPPHTDCPRRHRVHQR